MMDGVIFPESAAVKQAVQPVQHKIRQHQEQHRLQPQRQLGQWPVAIVVKRNQLVGVVNIEDYAGGEHEQPDPQYAREQWNEEPVANVGDEFALAPPGLSGIAGPEMR